MRKNRRRITIEVTPQTLYHLENMASEWLCKPGDVVDVLMMEHKENQRYRKQKERRAANHVRK